MNTGTGTTYSYMQARAEVIKDVDNGAIVAGCPFANYPKDGWVLAFAPDKKGEPVRTETRYQDNVDSHNYRELFGRP